MLQKGPWEGLLRYWLSKHIDGLPPSRGDIDPIIDIPHLAGVLMLLDVERAGYRYKVIGSKVEEWLGVYLTGRNLTEEGKHDSVMAQWRQALDHVKDMQEPLIYEASLAGTVSKYTTLILPLVDQAGATEMILVGCFPDGYIEPGSPIVSVSPVKFASKAGG